MTRSQVASVLECSISKVRTLEGATLFPEIGEHQVRYFDPAEVYEVATTRESHDPPNTSEGSIAACVFEELDLDQDLRRIVKKLKLPPEKVRKLFDEWRRAGEDQLRWQAVQPVPALRLHDAENLLADRAITEIRVARLRSNGEDEVGGFIYEPDGECLCMTLRSHFGGGRYRVTAWASDLPRALCVTYATIAGPPVEQGLHR